ncbi:MAG: hypothetical protein ABEJ31_02935 [Haloarculaceae archaeon]
MVDATAAVVEAVKFGYEEQGLKAAVVTGLAVGLAVVVVSKAVDRVSAVDEDDVDEAVQRVATDDELMDIVTAEVSRRLAQVFGSGRTDAAASERPQEALAE